MELRPIGELQANVTAGTLPDFHMLNNIQVIIDGLNKFSRLAEACVDRNQLEFYNTAQHGCNPTNPIDHPVMGGSVRPPFTSRPETGKPTTDSNNRKSE